MKRAVLMLAAASCQSASPAKPDEGHSGSIAVSADGKTVFVVNADLDSISVIDASARTLTREILLAGAHPAVDGAGAYTPAVMPRALAISPDGKTLWVTGERSGALYAVDPVAGSVKGQVAVGSEPVGVVASGDGARVYVAVSQDAQVVAVDTRTMTIAGTAQVAGEPWALAFAGGQLLATSFMGGVTPIDPSSMTPASAWSIPDVAPRGERRLAHGQARGLYDLAPRPGTSEIWVVHALLGTDTAQPDLDFESTAFPTLTLLGPGGQELASLSTDAPDVAGIDGAFADVVSGPHAIAFTPDGATALVVDSNSEDVLAVDAAGRVESSLLRPLPGHLPEGIAISPDGKTAWIDERNTLDVVAVKLDGGALEVDGAPIARSSGSDPMPTQLRLGQHLFYSANSDEYPITKNHWVACATCHMEGRSDAVTWKFAQGPRDTPSNAGGMLGTGFLFRTADRNQVQDYWHTVNVEQGGTFDPVQQKDLLDAIAAYVNLGIPLPVPPTTDATLVAKGKSIFERTDVGCAGCHSGPRFTDSGSGNPTLDLAGPITLYDVGTCVTTGYPDVAHLDVQGDSRTACDFDTPSLNGIASSPPYLHDGSAATLRDVLELTRGQMGDISSLSSDDEDALVEYLRSL